MLKEVRCYGLTICHPTNNFCWNSNSQCNGMRHWSLLKVFQKGWKEHLQSHLLWGRDYPDTKTRQGHHKKRKYWLISQINIDAKILNKILENQIQWYLKRILDNPLQYSCLGNLRQRSLASYSPLDHKVSGTT